MSDPINHPPHYAFGKHEPIDVIEDWQLGFNLGNTVKYIACAGRKGDALEDLRKARWYLEREIKRLSGQLELCSEHGCSRDRCNGQYHARPVDSSAQ